MNPFKQFLNNLLKYGLEYFGLYYGIYEGIVGEDDDPENRGRLQVYCPVVYGAQIFQKWALPKGMPSGNDSGSYFMPPKGSTVWVEFKNGNPEYPVWNYGWFPKGKQNANFKKGVYSITTPKGYSITLDENNDNVTVFFEKDKTIVLDADQIEVTFKDNKLTASDKLSFEFGGVNFYDWLKDFMSKVKDGQMVGSAGPYTWSPATIILIEKLILEFGKMMK